MVVSSDRGSLPFTGSLKEFLEGASKYGSMVDRATALFERQVANSLLEKLQTGIEVPTYPQFRDMNEMFLDMIEGIDKIKDGYIDTGDLSVKSSKGIVPEVAVLQARSKDIGQEFGDSFRLRVCVTGPYTLSSLFSYKDKSTFTRLGEVLTRIVENCIFDNKYASVCLVAVDEPVFGLLDDPFLDRGSEARENLLKAWESMMQKAASKGAHTSLHLHNTSNEMFWEIKSLNIIETHVTDPFYLADRTKGLLESRDKFLNASISITDFDELVRANIVTNLGYRPTESAISEKIAETWTELKQKQVDPTIFLENIELMKKRLTAIIARVGRDRVLLAGTECGLNSFPTHNSALECLRRVAQASRSVA